MFFAPDMSSENQFHCQPPPSEDAVIPEPGPYFDFQSIDPQLLATDAQQPLAADAQQPLATDAQQLSMPWSTYVGPSYYGLHNDPIFDLQLRVASLEIQATALSNQTARHDSSLADL